MRAMLLAAGEGVRMRPLSTLLPKPALTVLGRAPAVETLRRFAEAGIERAVVNLHHLAAEMRATLEGLAEGLPELVFSDETERLLGTAGGLRRAGDALRGDPPIVVCNADFLADIDLRAAVEAHRRSGLPATLVLTAARPGYSRVDVDDAGRVLSLAGKPPADPSRVVAGRLFTGCHILEEDVLDLIPASGPSDIVVDVYRTLAAEGRLGSWHHPGFWWEFGSPKLFLEGCLRLLELPDRARRAVVRSDPVRTTGRGRVALGPGARIHPSARLVGRVALGMSCSVAEACRIEDSVVLPEAWIAPSCSLERCLVAPGAELPAGFRAKDALVCPDPTGGELIVRPLG